MLGTVAAVGIRRWQDRLDAERRARYLSTAERFRLGWRLAEVDRRLHEKKARIAEERLTHLRGMFESMATKPSREPSLAERERAMLAAIRSDIAGAEDQMRLFGREAARFGRKEEHFRSLESKYEAAARQPRSALAPDPPEPE